MSFPKQIQLKPDEEILEIIREEAVAYSLKIVLILLWFITPFFFLFPLFKEGVFGIAFFFTLVLSASIYAIKEFFKWHNTTLIITDKRIFDVEQRRVFDRVVSEISIVRIDDVTHRTKGFFPTVFGFGSIKICVNGTCADVIFRKVKRPVKICNLINDLREVVLKKIVQKDFNKSAEKFLLKKASKYDSKPY
ncbi:MAG: PH domain-containing protein [Patescibacteria group bacterium]